MKVIGLEKTNKTVFLWCVLTFQAINLVEKSKLLMYLDSLFTWQQRFGLIKMVISLQDLHMYIMFLLTSALTALLKNFFMGILSAVEFQYKVRLTAHGALAFSVTTEDCVYADYFYK